VQYQIAESPGFEGLYTSLASVEFNISAAVNFGALDSFSTNRSALSAAQGSNPRGGPARDSQDPVPVPGTDSTGATTGTFAGVTGLHRVFRDALSPNTAAGNSQPSNGTPTATGIAGVRAFAAVPLNQLPVNDPTAWYGLYDFEVVVGNPVGQSEPMVALSISPVLDAQGFAWSGHEDGNTIPRQGRTVFTQGASFVVIAPAPAAVTLLAVAGTFAMRRRRTA